MDRSIISNSPLRDVDAIILCGGKGTRIAPILKDTPKALADIQGRPFLDILLSHLLGQGFRRFILAVGHLRQPIKDHFAHVRFPEYMPYEVEFSEEETPLGTGGALKKALSLAKSDHVMVMNGDCFGVRDFSEFYAAHLRTDALLSLALSEMPDVSDFGRVVVDDKSGIVGFEEKSSEKSAGLASAGTYFMDRNILGYMPERASFSLERDLFPRVPSSVRYGFLIKEGFIDIGVPERYEKSGQYFGGAGII